MNQSKVPGYVVTNNDGRVHTSSGLPAMMPGNSCAEPVPGGGRLLLQLLLQLLQFLLQLVQLLLLLLLLQLLLQLLPFLLQLLYLLLPLLLLQLLLLSVSNAL